MVFIARLRQHSVAWKNWHGAKQPSGSLRGVVFRWEPGDIYRSGVLTAAEVADLKDLPNVLLEMTTEPITMVSPVPDTIVPEPVKPRWQPPERFARPVKK